MADFHQVVLGEKDKKAKKDSVEGGKSLTDTMEVTTGTSGAGGKGTSKGTSQAGISNIPTAGDTTASTMPPPIANQGSRRPFSVASIIKQAGGTHKEVGKCLWHRVMDRFNNGKLNKFSELHFYYERMRYGGEDVKDALYSGTILFGVTAGIAFANQEQQTAVMARMKEQFKVEYINHRGTYLLGTENQIRNIVIQLYGVYDREAFHTKNLAISFTQQKEVGLYQVDIIKAKKQLRTGTSIFEEMGYITR